MPGQGNPSVEVLPVLLVHPCLHHSPVVGVDHIPSLGPSCQVPKVIGHHGSVDMAHLSR